MTTATTTPAGRKVADDRPLISTGAEKVLNDAERKRKAQASADALNVGSVPLETLPEPPKAKPSRPTTLAEAAPWLLRPFAQRDVELKPTATTQDKSRALASPYVDMRCYYNRLDKICGPENWQSSIALTERGAVCAITIFGVTKSATGDYPSEKGDENAATSAEAQAFKRACSAFGLGRYLYSLPVVWGEYNAQKKCFVDPARIIKELYDSLDYNAEK